MKHPSIFIGSFVTAALLSGAGGVLAGYHANTEVSIDFSNRLVNGQLGSARNSFNSPERIGVSIAHYRTDPPGVNAWFQAGDRLGNWVTCATLGDEGMERIAEAVGTDSYIQFIWSTDGFSCDYVAVINTSDNEPKE